MLNLAATDPTYDLDWSHDHQLISVDLGGGGTAHYLNQSGRTRVRKTITTSRGRRMWARIYLEGIEKLTTNEAGRAIEVGSHHVFVDQQRVLLVEEVRGGHPSGDRQIVKYQIGDHIGSSRIELDSQGRVISATSFHPYGSVAFMLQSGSSEVSSPRYQYAGMERDRETGLISQGARYYSATFARWCSPDPAGISTDANRYTYCRGRPSMSSDRGGRQPEEANQQDQTGFPLTEREVRRRLSLAGVIDENEIEVVVARWRREMQPRDTQARQQQIFRSGLERTQNKIVAGVIMGVAVGTATVAGPGLVAAAAANPPGFLAGAAGLAYGLLAPPGAPDWIPGPADDVGRAARRAADEANIELGQELARDLERTWPQQQAALRRSGRVLNMDDEDAMAVELAQAVTPGGTGTTGSTSGGSSAGPAIAPYRQGGGHHIHQSAANAPAGQTSRTGNPNHGDALAIEQGVPGFTEAQHDLATAVQRNVNRAQRGRDISGDPIGPVSVTASGAGTSVGTPSPFVEDVKAFFALLAAGRDPESALSAVLRSRAQIEAAGTPTVRVPSR